MPKLVNDSNNSTSVLDASKAAIAAAMQQIQKQYGTGSIMKLVSLPVLLVS